MSIRKQSIFTGELYFENDNKYYAEAATYAGRISGGDFSGANARCTPVFRLNVEDFSPKLKAELAALPKERIHEVVTEAVFRIFRARHKMIFYRYIENHRLRWEFV